MLRQEELQEIIGKAGESMVFGGNLDINLAASALKVVAERFFYLLKYPDTRPMQEQQDFLVAKI